jgi:hypothetical protein
MDTPSPKSKSWDQLTHHARSAVAPTDMDLRAAIRAEIAASPAQPPAASLFDDVLSLCRSRWLRTSFAVLTFVAILTCRESMDVVNELAWIWQLQGPVVAGI